MHIQSEKSRHPDRQINWLTCRVLAPSSDLKHILSQKPQPRSEETSILKVSVQENQQRSFTCLKILLEKIETCHSNGQNVTTDLIHYYFIGFAALPDANIFANRLNNIRWLAILSGVRIGRRNDPFFYCSSGQQTELFTVRVSIL